MSNDNANRAIVIMDFDHTISKHSSYREFIEMHSGSDECFRTLNNEHDEWATIQDYFEQNIIYRQELEKCGEHISNAFIEQEMFDFLESLKHHDAIDMIIVSGGARPCLEASAKKLGLQVFAVEWDYDNDNRVTGIRNDGFQHNKHKVVSDTLPTVGIDIKSYGTSLIIGDGENDYQVYHHKCCTDYICYVKYRDRHKIFMRPEFPIPNLSKDMATLKNQAYRILSPYMN